jgi:hypothetical protein
LPVNSDREVLEQGHRTLSARTGGEIDLGRRELRLRGTAIPIGGRAFEIIEVLVRAGGEMVGKYDLMSRVWPGAIVEDNTLQFHISAIRRALGADRELLKTVSGRGYRLLGAWTVRRGAVRRRAVFLQQLLGPPPRPVRRRGALLKTCIDISGRQTIFAPRWIGPSAMPVMPRSAVPSRPPQWISGLRHRC